MRKVRRMDSFDKKISDLYNADQSSNDLPEGFGWNEMNEGIYEKMEEPKRKKRFVWMWFSFAGSLFLLATLLFFFTPETKNIASVSSSNIEGTKTEKTPILLDRTTIENNLEVTENIQEISTETKKTNTTSIYQTFKKSPKLTKDKTEQTDIITSSIQKIDTKSTANSISIKQELTTEKRVQKIIVSTSEIPTTITLKTTDKSKNKTIVLSKPKVVSKGLSFIPIQEVLIPTKPKLAPPIALAPNHPILADNNSPDEDENDLKKETKFNGFSALQINGGTLLTSGKYSNNPLRNKHSKWLPGYYAGIELTVLQYKKWEINVGYEHKFAVQLFDFQNITDIIDTVIVDVLTGVSTNSLNGTFSENRETVPTQASRTRNYLNYNTFRAHAFRMTLVRTFDLSKKLSFNAGIGGSYNFLNRAKGRTVDSDENTLIYDPSTSVYRKNNFGIDSGFSLSYQIGKFSLNGNFWMEKSLNFSLESDEEIRPIFYKIGLGVSRNF